MMGRPPRQPIDLAVATKDVKARIERVLAYLAAIVRQREPVLSDPRAVSLDITLSIHELEAAAVFMKRAWWP